MGYEKKNGSKPVLHVNKKIKNFKIKLRDYIV